MQRAANDDNCRRRPAPRAACPIGRLRGVRGPREQVQADLHLGDADRQAAARCRRVVQQTFLKVISTLRTPRGGAIRHLADAIATNGRWLHATVHAARTSYSRATQRRLCRHSPSCSSPSDETPHEIAARRETRQWSTKRTAISTTSTGNLRAPRWEAFPLRRPLSLENHAQQRQGPPAPRAAHAPRAADASFRRREHAGGSRRPRPRLTAAIPPGRAVS